MAGWRGLEVRPEVAPGPVNLRKAGGDLALGREACTRAPLSLPQMSESRERRQNSSGGLIPGPGLWAACHSCG